MRICKHFEECGGCRSQNVSYRGQLAQKRNLIKELSRAAEFKAKLEPISYGKEWFYRNKMEFSFADQEGAVLGLYSKNQKGRVVDLEECLIFSPDTKPLLAAIKDFIKEKGYSVYNKYSHKGFLRNLILREAKFSGEIMVGLVTTAQAELDKELFLKKLLALKLKSKIKSIIWVVNDSLSDAVIFEKINLLYGENYISEKLGSLTFKISIDSFFQVNPRMLGQFYERIKTAAKLTKGEKALDLFCGAGLISLFLALAAKFVWGVELNEAVVDMARSNARDNAIENVSFIAADARKFLNGPQGIFYRGIDLLVINPPRSGLSNKVKRAIMRLEPGRIIYSSCNPQALFDDLKGLSQAYNPLFFAPFDFFPHTPHLECLTLLKKA